MPLLAVGLKMLFALSFFSSGFFTSGERLKQQDLSKLMEVQATRGMPPLGPHSLRESSSSGGGSHHSYGLNGTGRAIATEDKAAMAAMSEDALDKQMLYERLWLPGGTTHAATPSAQVLAKAFSLYMDKHGDGQVDLEELLQGMNELGHPMTYAQAKKFMDLADGNHNGKMDVDEFVAAAEKGKAARSSETVEKNPPDEQEAVKMIDSLIARDTQEYNTHAPKWSAFMQKLQDEGIQHHVASDVFMAVYKFCGKAENWRNGFHEKCVVYKLRPLTGKKAEQTLSDGTTFLQIFVQMVFVQLERQLQVYLKDQ